MRIFEEIIDGEIYLDILLTEKELQTINENGVAVRVAEIFDKIVNVGISQDDGEFECH